MFFIFDKERKLIQCFLNYRCLVVKLKFSVVIYELHLIFVTECRFKLMAGKFSEESAPKYYLNAILLL